VWLNAVEEGRCKRFWLIFKPFLGHIVNCLKRIPLYWVGDSEEFNPVVILLESGQLSFSLCLSPAVSKGEAARSRLAKMSPGSAGSGAPVSVSIYMDATGSREVGR
jgi:hypothetical protein